VSSRVPYIPRFSELMGVSPPAQGDTIVWGFFLQHTHTSKALSSTRDYLFITETGNTKDPELMRNNMLYSEYDNRKF